MINEADKIKLQESTDAEQKAECLEVIRAAAVYERKMADPDFQAILEHMTKLAELHQHQINGWMTQMESCSFFKRLKIMDTIMVHQIRKAQILEAVDYPKHIVHQAVQARELLDSLKEKENKQNA